MKSRKALSSILAALIIVIVVVAAVSSYFAYLRFSHTAPPVTTLKIGSLRSTAVGGLVAIAEAEGFHCLR